MQDIPKYPSAQEALKILERHFAEAGCEEAALVRNPSYVYAPLECYPLAPRPKGPLPRLAGIVKDMDGTTTTTEPLCLHSLEWMVRQLTGRLTTEQWSGLDHQKDYPHVIGNSTTKHVEYLMETYADHYDPKACLKAWIIAAAWTLSQGRDAGRKQEVRANLGALGLEALREDDAFQGFCEAETLDMEKVAAYAGEALEKLLPQARLDKMSDRVRAAVDVYYMRYHVILGDIADGKGRRRAEEVLGSADASLIEPMPAIGIMLATVKGWMGEELVAFGEELSALLREKNPGALGAEIEAGRKRLAGLGRFLQKHPAPVAVVTSSIAYEAYIVLEEVFGILQKQVDQWPVSAKIKDTAQAAFADFRSMYDGIITASDSSEIRLKPHRDLYSIALHQMGLGKEDLPCVVGFEDSESGVVAIRAAGVGCSVAVPFADTAGHDLSKAAYLLPGQMAETLLLRSLFLDLAMF